MKIISIIISIIPFLQLHANDFIQKDDSPYIASSKTVGHRAYLIEVGADYFINNALLGNAGEESLLNDDQSFTQRDLNIGITYGLRRDIDLFLHSKFRQNSLTNGELNSSINGIESFGGGFKYSFNQSSFTDFAIGAGFNQTGYSNTPYTSFADVPTGENALGDGESFLQANAYLSFKPSKKIMIDSQLSYRDYLGELSTELPYKAELVYLGEKIVLRGGLRGSFSLKNDEFSDSPLLKPIRGVQEELTNLYNSINRSYHMPYVGLNFEIGKGSRLEATFGQIMAGKNYDTGSYITGAFVYHFQTNRPAGELKDERFKDYSIEAVLTKVSPKGRFVLMDKGLTDDVEKGMRFDIFKSGPGGVNRLVASGVIHESKVSSSILRIQKMYRRVKLEAGFVARGRVH